MKINMHSDLSEAKGSTCRCETSRRIMTRVGADMRFYFPAILLLCSVLNASETMTLTGRILDATTLEPIPYVNIYIKGAEIGSASNFDGYFLFKCPAEYRQDTLVVSHVGYQSFLSTPSEMPLNMNSIHLHPQPIELPEIMAVTGRSIVEKAISCLDSNINPDPYLMTGFYREIIRDKTALNKYAEGVIHIHRAGGSNDELKLLKGRKRANLAAFAVHKKADPTLGGPIGCFYKDIQTYNKEFFTETSLDFYNYFMEGLTTLENKPVYIIRFDRRPDAKGGIYRGRLYVDQTTLAIVLVQYEYNKFGLMKAQPDIVQRNLAKFFAGLTFETIGFSATVSYFMYDGRWYIKSIHYEIIDKVTRKGIEYVYTTEKELLITDLQLSHVEAFQKSELLDPKKEFVDQLGEYDEDFWENHTILQATENQKQLINALHMDPSK